MSQTPIPYINIAKQGENALWRYLLGLAIIVFTSLASIVLKVFTVKQLVSNEKDMFDANMDISYEKVNPIVGFAIDNFEAVFLMAGIFLAIKFIHNRSFSSIITSESKINFRKIVKSIVVFLAILFIFNLINFLINPSNYSDYKITFQLNNFLLFLPIALIFVAVQASSEELLIRGYIMQGIGQVINNKIILIISTSLLFSALHVFNPELKKTAAPIMYLSVIFFSALFLAFITIKDGSLELAIGIHIANNLFSTLIVTYPPYNNIGFSIFFNPIPSDIDGISFIGSLVQFLLFYLIMFKWVSHTPIILMPSKERI